jgi:hypothetical protein
MLVESDKTELNYICIEPFPFLNRQDDVVGVLQISIFSCIEPFPFLNLAALWYLAASRQHDKKNMASVRQ